MPLHVLSFPLRRFFKGPFLACEGFFISTTKHKIKFPQNEVAAWVVRVCRLVYPMINVHYMCICY